MQNIHGLPSLFFSNHSKHVKIAHEMNWNPVLGVPKSKIFMGSYSFELKRYIMRERESKKIMKSWRLDENRKEYKKYGWFSSLDYAYQMMHWRTTSCTMRLWVKSPYMARSKGIPMTRVLGKVAMEKRVMSQSNPPWEKPAHKERIRSTRTFERVSASMNLVSIWYGLFWEMKWKERTGTAKTATKRLIPEHCSGVKIDLSRPPTANF